jgi:hypothetical protein
MKSGCENVVDKKKQLLFVSRAGRLRMASNPQNWFGLVQLMLYGKHHAQKCRHPARAVAGNGAVRFSAPRIRRKDAKCVKDTRRVSRRNGIPPGSQTAGNRNQMALVLVG